MDKQTVKNAFEKFKVEVSASWFLNSSEETISEKFEGEYLAIALRYSKELKDAVDSYGCLCGMTIMNARSHTARAMLKPVIKCKINPCSRCGGTGTMPFKHVIGGVCFKCDGSGKNK